MARMNWEKANRRDHMRRYSDTEIREPKRATDKQILTIYKYKMVDSISTEMTLLEAKGIISDYAAKHWTTKR